MPIRLNNEIVNEMRRAYRGGLTCPEMAAMADPPLNCGTVADAVFGRTWVFAEVPPCEPNERLTRRRKLRRARERRLTDEQVRELRRRYRAGETQTDLAAEYGYSQPGMSGILNGRVYAEVEGLMSKTFRNRNRPTGNDGKAEGTRTKREQATRCRERQKQVGEDASGATQHLEGQPPMTTHAHHFITPAARRPRLHRHRVIAARSASSTTACRTRAVSGATTRSSTRAAGGGAKYRRSTAKSCAPATTTPSAPSRTPGVPHGGWGRKR